MCKHPTKLLPLTRYFIVRLRTSRSSVVVIFAKVTIGCFNTVSIRLSHMRLLVHFLAIDQHLDNDGVCVFYANLLDDNTDG